MTATTVTGARKPPSAVALRAAASRDPRPLRQSHGFQRCMLVVGHVVSLSSWCCASSRR